MDLHVWIRADADAGEDVGRALEQLKVEPADDAELAHKFSVYEYL